MVLIAIGFAVFAVLQGVASTIVFLDIARFLLGVTIGISTVAAPGGRRPSSSARVPRTDHRHQRGDVRQPVRLHGDRLEGHTPLLIQGFVELFSALAVLVSVNTVDRLGRRMTLLTGVGVMIVSNVLMVVLFGFTHLSGGFTSGLGFIGILFFTAGFNFGFGALVWVHASEGFPAPLRTAGASAMLTSDLLANLLISRFFLTVFQDLGARRRSRSSSGSPSSPSGSSRRSRRRPRGGHTRRSARSGLTERIRRVVPDPLAGTAIVARGSSDQAALAGRYLIEPASGRPLSFVSPSRFTLYGAEVSHAGHLAVGVSHSGRTEEIVTTLRACGRAGRPAWP